jgi:hypothetical protein
MALPGRRSESAFQSGPHVVGKGQMLTQSRSFQRQVGDWAAAHKPQAAVALNRQFIGLE